MKKTILAAAAALLSTTALAMADEGAKRPGPEGMRVKMMQAMDADGDGKIQAGEFMAFSTEKAKERFAALDADGDGVVTEAEFSAAAVARSAAAFSKMDRNSDGVIGKGDAPRMKRDDAKSEKDGQHRRSRHQRGDTGHSSETAPE